jgi:hypothetical protein
MSLQLSTEFKAALMDCKSKAVYDRWWNRYVAFKESNKITTDDDGIVVFLDFIRHLSTTLKVSTLWQAASCVNKELKWIIMWTT